MSKYENRKKMVMFSIAGALLVANVILLVSRKPTIESRIRELRARTSPRFDSSAAKLYQKDIFYDNLNRLIQSQNTDIAHKIIDSAIDDNPHESMLRILRGMTFFKENKYNEAVQEYEIAMKMDKIEHPLALGKRAEALTKLKNYTAALNDYKKAAASNYDYDFEVAQTYERLGFIDSAVDYYSRILTHYPDREEIRVHIKDLSSAIK